MDSGHSGSLQSSSTAGDEEYDSRAADSFLTVSQFYGRISNPPPPFDPFSSFVPHHQNPIPFLLSPNAALPAPAPASPRPDPDDTIIASASLAPSFHPPVTVGANNAALVTAARKPKKRSRASRRAPTTVLATDTANFRSMVQEFTGIPSPPFDPPSLQRSRLDLFAVRSSALEPYPPPYLYGQFAQKAPSPPPFLSINGNFSSIPQTILNLPNPSPFLDSLLQTDPKFLHSSAMAASNPNNNQASFEFATDDVKICELIRPGNILQNLISSNPIGAPNNRDENIADINGSASWGIGDNGEGDDPGMRPVKKNFRAALSNFHGGRGTESSGASGTEGMVQESWVCSSDQ